MMSFTGTNIIQSGLAAGARSTALEQRFHDLLFRNAAALGRLAGSYARSVSDRDDLLQEIALGLWQALPSFRGECSDRTYLFRIAHNRAIAYLSRDRSRVEVIEDELDAPDPTPDAEAALLEAEAGHRLTRAVRALPLLYRQSIVLMLEGLEYSEIAEIMGISESNVGARLTRARQLLKKTLEGGK